jgi:vacuolar-type H+-ATPase subunit F/Vma7
VRIAAIGDQTTVAGLRLVGIREVHVASTGEDAERKFEELLGAEGVGLIVITETLAEGMRQRLLRFAERKAIAPIVVEIPDKLGPLPKKTDIIKKLARRAVGVEVLK